MSDGIQRILDDPASTQARLDYADSLAGHDDARADFIRAQVALYEIRRRPKDPPEYGPLKSKEDKLVKAHGAAWAQPVRDLAQAWTFRRGFVEEVTLDAAGLLARAPELYARAPILHLTLRGVRAQARRLFESPHLARVVSLRLDENQLGDDEARALAESPHLASLRWLSLYRNQIGQAGLEAIAASGNLPQLRYLDFDANAAPSPTPSVGGREDDYVHDMNYPPANLALRAKYGEKPWLTNTVWSTTRWPPDRDVF
jgi:uncharacterized protein (TIGR02996 family)